MYREDSFARSGQGFWGACLRLLDGGDQTRQARGIDIADGDGLEVIGAEAGDVESCVLG